MFSLFIYTNVMALGAWEGLKSLLASGLEGLFTVTSAVGLPSYALAIVLFTIIVKIALYPLSIKQMRSMREMQKLQPLIKDLQTKYKNDQKMLQQKQMELYKEYNVNPFGGCLPLLIQMPILFALFTVLRDFAPRFPEYYTFFWVADLSQPDPTKIILPILVGLSTFIQQYVSTTNRQDPTQKAMMIVMPLMLGWFTLNFASGLAIYWICFNLLGGLQQYLINKKGTPLLATANSSYSKENRDEKETESDSRSGSKKDTKDKTKNSSRNTAK